MTILAAISEWLGVSEPSIIGLLTKGGQAAPELKPSADLLLEKLKTEVTPEGLAQVAMALPAEGMAILRGKLDPHDQPGLHI